MVSITLSCTCGVLVAGRCVVVGTVFAGQDSPTDVIRLTLNILFEEVSNAGTGNLDAFKPAIIRCLAHDDRLVRQAAIHVLHEARYDDSTAIHELRRMVKEDETIIRREAAHALLDLDDSLLDSITVKCE